MSISFTMGDGGPGSLTNSERTPVQLKADSQGVAVYEFSSPSKVILKCPLLDISKVTYQNGFMYTSYLRFFLENGRVLVLSGEAIPDTPYREAAHKMQLLIKEAKAAQRASGKGPTKAGLMKSTDSLQAAGLLTETQAKAIRLDIKEYF